MNAGEQTDWPSVTVSHNALLGAPCSEPGLVQGERYGGASGTDSGPCPHCVEDCTGGLLLALGLCMSPNVSVSIQ